MKTSMRLAALAAALCLGCSLVAANDLTLLARVYDCAGNAVANATVRITGCVDPLDGQGGISTTTNSDGLASFLKGQENSIQYCYGVGIENCTVQVASNDQGLTYAPQTTTNPQDYICATYGCCPACRNPACPDNGPIGGPSLDFYPVPSTCTPTPPPTCFGWFGPTYVGSTDLSTVAVTSASFRSNQMNDITFGNVLTSGAFSLNANAVAPFITLTSDRWGWEQLWNVPTTGMVVQNGYMFCGQNKYGGNIKVTLTATSLVYEITMSTSSKFTAGDVHVYAACSAFSGGNVAPGKLNCNPSKPSGCATGGQLLAGGSAYNGTIAFGGCTGGQLFTMFHLGM
ncbi:hypothetical protein OEZ86_001696 [Tetradesmus obliquus]|nr:hypothetical protein OEZ86_001696 [Tetradesmus obliquus]